MIFTIAIPTYNNEKTIRKAVLSALNQNYNKNYEILIVNNFSSDNTLESLNDFKEKIIIISNKNTVSMYDNHNICLEHAKGDYVLFCHADDELFENALSILEDNISKKLFPNRLVIWGRSLYRDFEPSWVKAGISLNNILSGMFSFVPFYFGGLTPSGTCYSKKQFLSLGGFLKSNTTFSPSDMSTMLMLASQGFEFEMIDRILFKRTFASTANFTIYREVLYSKIDVLEELKKAVNTDCWKMIVSNSFNIITDPIDFHAAILHIEKNKKISKYYLRKIILQPKTLLLILLEKKYRYLYKLVIFNFFRRSNER